MASARIAFRDLENRHNTSQFIVVKSDDIRECGTKNHSIFEN